LSVLLPSIHSLRYTTQVLIPVAVVENAETTEEEANVSPVCTIALKTSKEESQA